ncbi:MAG: ABC transporter ATP-binding protein [Candidatus Cloacimonetes bacterium]|nr:ABC transporter ATP-binding protein [Candidatus Cloacimonadota bacterium]
MIDIRDIEMSYADNKVLNRLSTSFCEGDFSFILGPNGAGKTTLLKTINKILAIDKGDIFIDGISINQWKEKELAQKIAFIPQEFHLQFDYKLEEFLLMGRYPWMEFLANYKDKDYELVKKYIKLLDLTKFMNRYFNQLSGGEKQRVLIARALVQDTKCILMDESLSSLDINHQIEILQMLRHINQEQKKTIVMVSHNLNLSAEFADKIVFVKEGQVYAEGSAKNVFNEKYLNQIFEMDFAYIQNPYTKVNNIVYKPEIK